IVVISATSHNQRQNYDPCLTHIDSLPSLKNTNIVVHMTEGSKKMKPSRQKQSEYARFRHLGG
ncbi:MAG: hypothetical protein KUG69_03660, partial [Marinosulfonomonas sp.]|nr:hypothetical protein [Marinosulfonomonas sp.]